MDGTGSGEVIIFIRHSRLKWMNNPVTRMYTSPTANKQNNYDVREIL